MLSRYRIAAPTAEGETENPSTKPLTPAEYQQMLSDNFTSMARDIGELTRRSRQAEERTFILPINAGDFATMKSIPNGDWKYVIVNRPGVGEQGLATLNPYTLHLDNHAYYLPAIGFAVFPVLGEKQVGIFTTALGTSPVPTGNWSVELFFTNRPDISSSLVDNIAFSFTKTISVTPNISVLAYSPNDVVGGLLTFADAFRVAGAGGTIHALEIIEGTTPRTISGNTLANPTVVTTTTAHGLVSGETVTISGSNSTPTIDGARVVTVISPTTFSVPVNVTVAGTAGSVQAAARAASLELWLFDGPITPAADNAPHSISNADAAKCIGVISSGPYYASALNAVSVTKGIGLSVMGVSTSLYGLLVTRGTPTYGAATNLTVRLTVLQD